jgi:YVTN family beta-propeller protein
VRSHAAVVAAFAIVVGLAGDAPAQPTDLSAYALFGDSKLKIGAQASVTDGAVGSNEAVRIAPDGTLEGPVAGDAVSLRSGVLVQGAVYHNRLSAAAATIQGATVSPVALPLLTLPPPPAVASGSLDITVARGVTQSIAAGAYRVIDIDRDARVTLDGSIDCDVFIARGRATDASWVDCNQAGGCLIRVGSLLRIDGMVGLGTALPVTFSFAGTRTVKVGRPGSSVTATVSAPLAHLKLGSSHNLVSNFHGSFSGGRVTVGSGAVVGGWECGDGIATAPEACDGSDDSACPGQCLPDCSCAVLGGLALHAVGPSVLNNATDFGVQLFGAGFEPGAELELSDQATSAVIETLPTTFVSSGEITARIPAGMAVPSGIQRELVARVVNPGGARSNPPGIGHCAVDLPSSPVACTSTADCPPGAGSCVTGDQRLTMFNDLAFLNPNSAALAPAPHGLCDDGAPCDAAGDCAGIGSGACSPKLYVTPQQLDELWVFNTGTGQFIDRNAAVAGIQGIPVGDNPFHVEALAAGGSPRVWVINRFDDALSIIDPATDAEIARVTGAALGVPGRLRMGTEVEFNRAGTRAYVSNQNLDEVQVFDVAGANRDAPVLLGTIDVGVNPRGMATNAADTRLYVANIQSADISVVDIAPGSASENQVVATIGTRPTDDIVGGRADGWEPFVIGGRAPRGIIFSDDLQALFVTSIGPQTGPRAGVNQVGGAIINPTVTVIDADSASVVAHVALNGRDPNRPKCTDPELMALDDVRHRLYVTCQGSGTIDILDTLSLVAASPAELHLVSLPLPSDATVPTLATPAIVGPLGAKVCAAFTNNPGTPCTNDGQCLGCPILREGLPVECCAMNNPIGLHNGPRGIALSADGTELYVINQFTTSVSTIDVAAADPAMAAVVGTASFLGAFGTNPVQSDRRLGQIEFFTDVKGTNVSCATCHIDDHQDGVFFEADVAGPRLRRVLSLRGTRDFPPLLQDQLLPDLVAFTDIVVHIERFGPICTPCTELNGNFTCFPAPEGTCTMTSNSENQQNTLYAKAVTFFPNPNLNADGSFSTGVPLPGGLSGNALNGEVVFDQLACATCHPEPMFTLDQFRVFQPSGFNFIQSVRMREVQTPVHLPLRSLCQDANRPTGVDGSAGFGVPTLRGIWDTFPLLMSGSAGLQAVGPEPTFGPCTPGSSGCCAQLQSPLNPGGMPVPPQYLEVSTKDALRATLTAPLAVPGSGHGAALALTAQELNDLIAYLRSL